MSSSENKPIIVVERAWETEASKQELVTYVPDENGEHHRKIINFIPIDDGTRGVEHLVMHTFKTYLHHITEADIEGEEIFIQFAKCLSGSSLAYWDHIVFVEPGFEDRNMDTFREAFSFC
jgi:hypothetical protein